MIFESKVKVKYLSVWPIKRTSLNCLVDVVHV